MQKYTLLIGNIKVEKIQAGYYLIQLELLELVSRGKLHESFFKELIAREVGYCSSELSVT